MCLVVSHSTVVDRTVAPLADNGEAAWRRRGGHYRFTEPQTVNFPDAVSQSYTPACAKPLVVSRHFTDLY